MKVEEALTLRCYTEKDIAFNTFTSFHHAAFILTMHMFLITINTGKWSFIAFLVSSEGTSTILGLLGMYVS